MSEKELEIILDKSLDVFLNKEWKTDLIASILIITFWVSLGLLFIGIIDAII